MGFHLQPPGRPLPLASSSVWFAQSFLFTGIYSELWSVAFRERGQLGTVKVGGQRFTVADPGEPHQVSLK